MALAFGGAQPAAADPNGPARKKPLDDFAMMEFLDTVHHARVLDRICTSVFNPEQKEAVFLGFRWARSVAATDAYPTAMLLVAVQTQGEYARALKGTDCAGAKIRDLARSFDPFLAKTIPATVRLSEIR
jgi:hypothetical protein